ncbi:MAG: PASTA domain-containing protein, partial [Acidimicrobiales bacterium]
GLGIGPVTERHVEGTEPGLIIATDPAPGTQAPRDTPVSVVVSAPAESARAPALAGLLEATARAVASQGGFGISVRAQRLAEGDGRIGRVISQDIPPGTAVSPGLTLGVVVGVAPPPPPTTTTVPTTVPAGGAATTIAPGG